MSDKELNLFKDEVLKQIREIEMKLYSEISKINSELNINYDNFSHKVNAILEKNNLIVESISSQKLHIEKINKLELKTKEIKEQLFTTDVRLNSSLEDIRKMKFNYDKIIYENLIIPAYIGPGSIYKSLGDFIMNSIDEMKKFKYDKEVLKQEIKELKNKIDSVSKNISNFIEMNNARCRAYTDTREKEISLKIDEKFHQLDEKSMETNKKIYTNQILIDNKLKDIGDKISVLPEKNNITQLINDKFEKIQVTEKEINDKMNINIHEVNELKNIKKELNEQIKKMYLKIEYLNRKINSGYYNVKKNNIKAGNTFHINNYNNINNKNRITNAFKVPSLCNYFSKTEEGNNDNKIHSINNMNRNSKENTFRKSNYLMKKDSDYKDLDKNSLTNKEESNNNRITIKEKMYQKSLNNLKLNMKQIKSNLFLNNSKKEVHKKIKLESTHKKNYYKLSPEKALIEFSKKFQTINNDKSNTQLQNILTQTINEDENNNNKNIRTELINEYIDDNNNLYNTNENVKVVDCNVVNLNLLDLPKKEKEKEKERSNNSCKFFKHNSLKINIKNSFKSLDSKNQIKMSPAFGRTSYAFYNSKKTREMFNNANLNLFKVQPEFN